MYMFMYILGFANYCNCMCLCQKSICISIRISVSALFKILSVCTFINMFVCFKKQTDKKTVDHIKAFKKTHTCFGASCAVLYNYFSINLKFTWIPLTKDQSIPPKIFKFVSLSSG